MLIKTLNVVILFFCNLSNKLKTKIADGTGQCEGVGEEGVTSDFKYVCGQGSMCNSWENRTCWSPKSNQSILCLSTHWQCSVVFNF